MLSNYFQCISTVYLLGSVLLFSLFTVLVIVHGVFLSGSSASSSCVYQMTWTVRTSTVSLLETLHALAPHTEWLRWDGSRFKYLDQVYLVHSGWHRVYDQNTHLRNVSLQKCKWSWTINCDLGQLSYPSLCKCLFFSWITIRNHIELNGNIALSKHFNTM